MAKVTQCDLCGAPAIGPVSVIVQSHGTVVAGQPTASISKELDSCEDCREKALRRLFEESIAQHQASIPIQRALLGERALEAMLRDDLKQALMQSESPGRPMDIDETVARISGELQESLARQEAILDKARVL